MDLLFIVKEKRELPLSELIEKVENFMPDCSVIVEQEITGWLRGNFSSQAPQEKKIALFSGIARPHRFQALLEAKGYTVVDTFVVGDHEPLLSPSFVKWKEKQRRLGIPVVGTEKDWARHAPWKEEGSPCFFTQIELVPVFGEGCLERMVQKIIQSKR